MDKKVQEALQVVDNVCADFHGTRKDHAILQQALQIIYVALDPKKKSEKIKVPKKALPRDRKRKGKK